MEAESNNKDQDMFHTNSYMLLLDGIIWHILSMITIIYIYVISWIHFSEVNVLKMQVLVNFMVLLLLLSMVITLLILLDLLRHGGLGFINSKMVLANRASINKLYELNIRKMYRFMNGMWYYDIYQKIIIKLFLMNNNIIYYFAPRKIAYKIIKKYYLFGYLSVAYHLFGYLSFG
eukprot:345989_1